MKMKVRSTRPREILLEITWRKDLDLSETEIWYVDRGAPGDVSVVGGTEVVIERSFMGLGSKRIPYHRIIRIVLGGHVVFERSPRS